MHAERGHQQYQHAGMGDRLEGDAVEHRAHRRNQRDRQQNIGGLAQLHRRQCSRQQEQGDR